MNAMILYLELILVATVYSLPHLTIHYYIQGVKLVYLVQMRGYYPTQFNVASYC